MAWDTQDITDLLFCFHDRKQILDVEPHGG